MHSGKMFRFLFNLYDDDNDDRKGIIIKCNCDNKFEPLQMKPC